MMMRPAGRLKLHHQILIAMLVGAGIGLPLNILAEPKFMFTIDRAFESDLEQGEVTPALREAFEVEGIELSPEAAVRKAGAPNRFRIVDRDRHYIIRDRDDALGVRFGRIPEYWPRTIARYGKGIGDVFLRLLSMIVAPLIFTSLISGITANGTLEGLGRLGARTLAYYLSTSMIAIFIGMLTFNVIQPGLGSHLAELEPDVEQTMPDILAEEKSTAEVLWEQVFNLIPANPIAALADPTNQSILGVIFFAILFGVFITVVGGEMGDRLSKFFQAVFAVMMKMTMFIIRLAPFGVFGFMLYASAGKGLTVFEALGWYALTVAVGLTFHAFVTLPLAILVLARRSPWEYFQAMSPALLTAFSTASSSGTLPLTLTCAEKRAGISNRTSSFVLPLGATVNMDGTALYEAVAVLFIAQVVGADLTFAQQIIVAFTALLASIGAAGIPHAGTVMMVVVLSAVGLPIEYVGLILAVDRVLDMYRTSVNVWSDSVACAVIARFEGETPTAPAAKALTTEAV